MHPYAISISDANATKPEHCQLFLLSYPVIKTHMDVSIMKYSLVGK
jgi:hypothetical protein